MRKIKRFLQEFDFIWSVPLAIAFFWLCGILLTSLDVTASSFDLVYIQPLFLAGCAVIFSNGCAMLGIYFSFRVLYRFIYGEKKGQDFINASKEDFLKLKVWQKFVLFMFVFSLYFVSIITIYLHLI